MRGVRTWEFANFKIVIDILKSPQVKIRRDLNSIKGFTPRDTTILPACYGKFLYEFDLSLLYPKCICYLLLGLDCLLSQLSSLSNLLRLFMKILHQLLLYCQINFSKMKLFALFFSSFLSIFEACVRTVPCPNCLL